MIALMWVIFILFILGMLALDLGVFHRQAHEIGTREALLWTCFWIVLSLIFNAVVYFMYNGHWLGMGEQSGQVISGSEAALQFITGYLIEKSLSLDNIFVIAVIFNYFAVPLRYQHRVLFWGIIGALILRGLMIGIGTALIHQFDWIIYVFGLLLIYTSVKMLVNDDTQVEPEHNPFVRVTRRWFPVTKEYQTEHFFMKLDGVWHLTPLFLVLLVVESSDVLFAVDSIPAIFAITTDPFLVFTSNVCAILGLRSLYFFLASILVKFHYLKYSLVLILAFVGIKMLLSDILHIHTGISLTIIFSSLLMGLIVSKYVSSRTDG